jgi:hypothetical protein
MRAVDGALGRRCAEQTVDPLLVPIKHHDTHGSLTATLVNEADPSDSVVLNLHF